MTPRRRPTDGPPLVERARVFEVDDPAPYALVVGHTTMMTTETSPRIPPECYPFLIFWWPLALLNATPEQLAGRVPLYTVPVHEPGVIEVPTASAWSGSVCIELVYADGSIEWVGP